jgi:hypothetical protein
VALGQVFSEYFGFPCQSLFHQFLHTRHHPSSGAGTIGQWWLQYEETQSHPTNNNNNNNTYENKFSKFLQPLCTIFYILSFFFLSVFPFSFPPFLDCTSRIYLRPYVYLRTCMPVFAVHLCVCLLVCPSIFLHMYVWIYLYRVSQEETSLFWEVIASAILSKKLLFHCTVPKLFIRKRCHVLFLTLVFIVQMTKLVQLT